MLKVTNVAMPYDSPRGQQRPDPVFRNAARDPAPYRMVMAAAGGFRTTHGRQFPRVGTQRDGIGSQRYSVCNVCWRPSSGSTFRSRGTSTMPGAPRPRRRSGKSAECRLSRGRARTEDRHPSWGRGFPSVLPSSFAPRASSVSRLPFAPSASGELSAAICFPPRIGVATLHGHW